MIGDGEHGLPERADTEPASNAERAAVTAQGAAELSDLGEAVRAEVILGPFANKEDEAAGREALEFAYAQGYARPDQPPQTQREVAILLQELVVWHGDYAAIPPEEITSILRESVQVKVEAQARDLDNQDRRDAALELKDLRARFPDKTGEALIDAMLSELPPGEPGRAEKVNILRSIRLLLESDATRDAASAAMESGAAFDVATLRTIAPAFFDDPSVGEEQKTELRQRLGLAEAIPRAKGRIPASPKDFEKQLIERGTVEQQVQRITVQGWRRELGLGSARLVTLAEAREAALENRRQARSGIDPLAERRKVLAVAPNFETCARACHEESRPSW